MNPKSYMAARQRTRGLKPKRVVLMLKKILPVLSVCCVVLALTAGAACAKPQTDIFRNSSRDTGKIMTVLVMPLVVSAEVPDDEHFFTETLEQTWNEVITEKEAGLRFIFKTPEQILEFEKLFTSLSTDETEDEAARALALAPLYADAVMTLTVTEATRGIISHDAQRRWNPGVRLGGGYWHGGWHQRGGVILQSERIPAYDEFYSLVALKIEIRDSKDGQNTLICGVSARDVAKNGMLPGSPSLTKLADTVVRAAAAELAKL